MCVCMYVYIVEVYTKIYIVMFGRSAIEVLYFPRLVFT